MKRTDVRIALPYLQGKPPYLDFKGVACSIFESDSKTIFFVEAPNWARAFEWAPSAALLCWLSWEREPTRLNRWNPADLDNFFIYRIRPGYPKVPEVWKEPFSWYASIPRYSPTLQRLIPLPGTALVKESTPQSLGHTFNEHDIPVQDLQHFTRTGELRASKNPSSSPEFAFLPESVIETPTS